MKKMIVAAVLIAAGAALMLHDDGMMTVRSTDALPELTTHTLTNAARSPARQCAYNAAKRAGKDNNLDADFISDDGVVIDKRDSLVWMRCSVGQRYQNGTCEGDPQLLNSRAIPKHLEMANAGQHPAIGQSNGYKWRLPTAAELHTILHVAGCGTSPHINTNIFENHIGATERAPYFAWHSAKRRDDMLSRSPESLGDSKTAVNFGACESTNNPGCHGGVHMGYIRFVADPG